MNIQLSNKSYEISTPVVGAIRIRNEKATTALDRYNVYKTAEKTGFPNYELTENELILKSDAGEELTRLSITENEEGWQLNLNLAEGEKLYGLGDINRARLDKRGFVYRIWVINCESYIPIPFLLSNRGWAICINTTFEHFFDVGATQNDKLRILCYHGAPDLTLYTGKDYAEIIDRFTDVSGKPIMLPRWAMGLTYVCNQEVDAFRMIDEALTFRREDMPCDIIGLEPGWMADYDPVTGLYYYDYTTEKNWHPERFYMPFWNTTGPNTFVRALERLQFKLSLWLCCSYDLFHYEEKLIGVDTIAERNKLPDIIDHMAKEKTLSFEIDLHLANQYQLMDKVTKPEEPWFEHLKKFVDQGVAAFKLDGSDQVEDHPDRLWGNGMTDKEAHNLYPLILAKQMSNGFAEYTSKRPMIYTDGGYTGIQQYAATWAGDTGGGFGVLVSLLNLGMCGHSNGSCDMNAYDISHIHFGFLMPWSQLNNWAYWREPWLLEDKEKQAFIEYDHLRYTLIPYLYTAAHQSTKTAMPIMRSLEMMYPDDEMACERLAQYMLGDSLMVGAFLNEAVKTNEKGEKYNMYLPEGEWYDFFTGEKYEGKQEIYYVPPKGKGGALFVKSGSAIPMVEKRKAVGDKPFDHYIIRAWGENATGLLYDDDGLTFGYKNGEYTLTKLSVINGELKTETTGAYPGMPENVTYTLGEIIK